MIIKSCGMSKTGRFPLQIIQKFKILQYWSRILSLPTNHPVKKAYVSLKQNANLGCLNWCTNIRNILEEIHLDNILVTQCIKDKTRYIGEAKESITCQYMDSCAILSKIQPKIQN